MLKLLFAKDVTLEIVQIKPAHKDPVGYVFASAGAWPMGQEQRWVLYEDYENSEGTEFMLRIPPEKHRYKDLEAWHAAMGGVNGIWKDGAVYGVVHATSSGSLYPELTSAGQPLSPAHLASQHLAVGAGSAGSSGPQRRAPIEPKLGAARPKVLDRLTFLQRPNYQLVDRVAVLQHETTIGHAFGTRWETVTGANGDHQVNQECWVMSPSYAHATYQQNITAMKTLNQRHGRAGEGGLETTIRHQREAVAVETMAEFLADIQQNHWVPGSSVINAKCAYYDDPSKAP